MPEAPREEGEEGGPRRVALVGRPNVGKSSLLNRLAKDERSVVDSVAGTTVDPVDSIVTLGGEEWRFVDTAGPGRKGNNRMEKDKALIPLHEYNTGPFPVDKKNSENGHD